MIFVVFFVVSIVFHISGSKDVLLLYQKEKYFKKRKEFIA